MSAPSIHAPDGSALDNALHALKSAVESQRGGDANYFRNQLPRYSRAIARMQLLKPTPCRVLDIGSHYLHQSALLASLGHDVTGIDIELFTDAAFVMQRARTFGINNVTVNALETGDFLAGHKGCFDLIVFTEILEHITFNPVRLWRRVHELLSPDGVVYISTPNALRPAAWLRQLRALLVARGIGISVEDILGNVTYGHHWKEYSAWEIERYFALLSDDFAVRTQWYSSDLSGPGDWKLRIKKALAVVPCLRSDIEAVVRRRGDSGMRLQPPELPLQVRTQPPGPTEAHR